MCTISKYEWFYFILLVFSGLLADVAPAPVPVSSSAEFAVALVNPNTSEVVVKTSFGSSRDTSRQNLTLQPEDFNRAGPVRIRAGQSILVRPDDPSQRLRLDFSGLQAAIVVDFNASLALEDVLSEGAASDANSRVDGIPVFVPWLVTRGTIVVYPGATVSFSDVVFLRQMGACLDFATTLQSSLAAAFGSDAVTVDGPVLVHLSGRHVLHLPPNATSTQITGLPVTVVLENVTYVCLPDPTSLLTPSGNLAATVVGSTLSPWVSMQLPAAVVVSSSSELAGALNNDSVSAISLAMKDGQRAGPVTVTLQQSDFPAPATLASGRHVSIFSGDQGGFSELDFNNLLSVILLRPNSSLAFVNMTLANVASALAVDPATYPHPAARFLWAWPSVIAENGSLVSLLNSRVNVYADCANFRDISAEQVKVFYGPQNVLTPDNQTLTLLGQHTLRLPLQDVKTGQQVGQMVLASENATAVCFDDPLQASWPARAPSGAQMFVPRSKSNLGLILGLSLGLGVGLMLLAAGLGLFLVVGKARDKKRQESVPSTEGTASQAAMASSPGGTISKDPLGSAEIGSVSPHAGALWQLRFLGSLEDEQVEIGPLLGRGGFGRVYKGRWKGAVVAIKVVDHGGTSQGEAAQNRMDRESLLSTSLSHPNVVTTYKISTVKATGRVSSASRSPEDTPMENAGHHGPERAPGAAAHETSDSATSEDMLETWLVMEYCDRGSLLQVIRAGRFIKKDGSRDLLAMYRCLLDIATGMDYLHAAGIIHGDLKTANIMLKSTTSDSRGFTCKLGDFGLSHILSPNMFSHVVTRTHGTMAYMPPELLKSGLLSRATDIFSFAMVMWELFCGDEPYSGMAIGQIFYKIAVEDDRPPIPANCPPQYFELMQSCWATDPAGRPTFPEVMQSLQKVWQELREQHQRRKNSGTP
eukprot:jgi/Botrbrau1/18595/Bobra.0367s0037.1